MTAILPRRRLLALAAAGVAAPALRLAAEPPLTLLAPEGRPYNFLENGALTGMFVELVREAFRRTGRAVDIRLLPWARCMEEVRHGRADGFYVVYSTGERQHLYDFTSEPLQNLQETVYIRSDADFDFDRDFATLRRKRVGILEYTSHSARILRAVENGQIGRMIPVSSYETLARMLATGRLDLVLAVRDAMKDAIEQSQLQDRVRQLEPAVDVIPAYLVFTRQRDLSAARDAFDQALAAMKADGSYDRIIGRYGSTN